MPLKFKSRDEIPAEQAALYVERDGGWVLDVDGAADKPYRAEIPYGQAAAKALLHLRQAS